MSSESVIHIKLDYMEALKARRSILSSELGSLNIEKKIGRYWAIRMEELGLKERLYVKMKETRSSIKKLQSLLPNPKIPKIIKREEAMEKVVKAENWPNKIGPHSEGDIESQLREIQRRLNELQREDI